MTSYKRTLAQDVALQPTAPSRQVHVTMYYSHEEGVEPYELGDVPIPVRGDEIQVGPYRTFVVTGVKYTYRPTDPGWCHVTVWSIETTSDSPVEVFDDELNEWRPMTAAEMVDDKS